MLNGKCNTPECFDYDLDVEEKFNSSLVQKLLLLMYAYPYANDPCVLNKRANEVQQTLRSDLSCSRLQAPTHRARFKKIGSSVVYLFPRSRSREALQTVDSKPRSRHPLLRTQQPCLQRYPKQTRRTPPTYIPACIGRHHKNKSARERKMETTLPWNIQRQLQQSEQNQSQGQQQRRSIFLDDKWALRMCHQCRQVCMPRRSCGRQSTTRPSIFCAAWPRRSLLFPLVYSRRSISRVILGSSFLSALCR